eukprot:213302-Hanusia_phi.AAC.1
MSSYRDARKLATAHCRAAHGLRPLHEAKSQLRDSHHFKRSSHHLQNMFTTPSSDARYGLRPSS